MATRGSFVLLADGEGLKSSVLVAAESSNDWLEVEQTEPLNLCLNTFAMVEYYPEFIDCAKLENGGAEDGDDVIFVKEYQVRRERKVEAGGGSRRAGVHHPRRNPVRRTRTLQQRFSEFTDGSALDMDMADFIESNANDDEIVDYEDYSSSKNNNEDVDDWNVQMCRTKPKRRILTTSSRKTKFNRIDRRRKKLIDETRQEKNKNKNKNKEPIQSLQAILQSNLLLVKDYVKSVSSSSTTDSATRQKAVNLFKQQATFLAIAKNLPLENNPLLELQFP